MKRTCPPLLLALAAVMAAIAREPSDSPEAVEPQVDRAMPNLNRLDGNTSAERGAALVRHVAACKPAQETYPKAAAPAYAARLLLNVDTRYALEKLDAAVRSRIAAAKRESGLKAGNPLNPPGLDPFDKVALVNTYFLCKDKIPRATALKIRDYSALYAHKVWRGYGAMNYRLMMDGAGFLAAEEWPELVDADKLNATDIQKATRERLFGYFDTICRSNFDEYGAPIYLAVDLSAVRMLAEFARDPEMRKRAALTLDAMLLDLACTWNQGYNIGSASRAKYWYSTRHQPRLDGLDRRRRRGFFSAPTVRCLARAGRTGSGWRRPGAMSCRSQSSRWRRSDPSRSPTSRPCRPPATRRCTA